MDIVIGGAYQGKLDFARERFYIAGEDIFICADDADIDFSKRCIYSVERFVLGCVRRGEDAVAIFDESRGKWSDSIIICEEIFSGVVPIDPVMRAWREATGRLMNWLTPQARSVTRMFCGLPQVLK